MKPTLLVIAVIMLFACQKETSYQCLGNWSSVTDTGCLVSTITYTYYRVVDGNMDHSSAYNQEMHRYSYDGRKLLYYYAPYKSRYMPVSRYEYNACNQLVRVYNKSSLYDESIKEILYLGDGSGRIDREILISATAYINNNARMSNGYIQHYYRKNIVYSCQYDSLKNKVVTLDSTIYNDEGIKQETWWNANQKTLYKIKDNNKPNVGDEIKAINLSNNIIYIQKTDSVFRNENGMDTLTYTSEWYNNELTGFILKRTTYNGCK